LVTIPGAFTWAKGIEEKRPEMLDNYKQRRQTTKAIKMNKAVFHAQGGY